MQRIKKILQVVKNVENSPTDYPLAQAEFYRPGTLGLLSEIQWNQAYFGCLGRNYQVGIFKISCIVICRVLNGTSIAIRSAGVLTDEPPRQANNSPLKASGPNRVRDN